MKPFVSPCCCVFVKDNTYNYFSLCGWCTGKTHSDYECWCIPGQVDTYCTLCMCGKHEPGFCAPLCCAFLGPKRTYCPCGFYDDEDNFCCLTYYSFGKERNGCFPLCNNCGANKTCFWTGACTEDFAQDIEDLTLLMFMPCCARYWSCCGICGSTKSWRYCFLFFFQRKEGPPKQTMN